MYRTEKTYIKPCYGVTLKEVVDRCCFETQIEGLALYFNGNIFFKETISRNPHAIKLLEQLPEFISVRSLCSNSAAGDFLYNHPDLPQYHDLWCCRSPIFDTILRSTSLLPPYTNLYDRSMLSRNPKAIQYLLRHPKCIVFEDLSMNENALDILEAWQDVIDYRYLSRNTNPRAMVLLRKAIDQGMADRVNWKWLSANSCPEAVQLLLEHPEKIAFDCLSENECPLAFPIMQQNLDKINWHWFCCNPLAVPLLPHFLEKINWPMLSARAKTKEQFDFLRAHLSRIDWPSLSKNGHPQATQLLEEHPDKISWRLAISCHNVFETITEYDYRGIRNAREALHAEFHAWAGHPSKMETKWWDWGFLDSELLEG
jgi:hypothetical protein